MRTDARELELGELAQRVRKAVMISMTMTGKVGTYTHDHYDEAHAALNELVDRVRNAESPF